MKATIKTIAEEAGVSVATISYVLNDTGNISPAVRERIKKIIKKQNYTPRAKKTKINEVKKILVVINPHGAEDQFNLYDSMLLDGCERAIVESGNSMQIHHYSSDKVLKAFIKESRPDGILLIAKIGFDPKIPTVGVTGATTKSERIDFVRCDDEYAGFKAAELLKEQSCTKPACVNFEPDHPAFIYRQQHFKLKANELSMTTTFTENRNKELCLKQLVELIREDKVDSVFISGSDHCTITTCMYLMKNRIVPGDDVKVICCANATENYELFTPEITILDLNINYFGVAALNCLLQRIKLPELPLQRVLLRPTLIENRSK